MKKLVFLVGIIFSIALTLKAQEPVNNFILENNKIIWQKVFVTEMYFDELVEKIKESGIFVDPEIGENKILGQTKSIEADFVGAGYREMSTPMYVARSFFEGFVIIDYKDGKYRTTIKNIMLTQKYDDGITEEGEKSKIESFGVKSRKSKMKRGFTKSPSVILDYTFIHEFDFKQDTDDDW